MPGKKGFFKQLMVHSHQHKADGAVRTYVREAAKGRLVSTPGFFRAI